MGWQQRSSGNNYASLSGRGFLIDAHTRRIIACVVFSKKCSICEARKRKPGVAITSTAPAEVTEGGITSPTVLEDISQEEMGVKHEGIIGEPFYLLEICNYAKLLCFRLIYLF